MWRTRGRSTSDPQSGSGAGGFLYLPVALPEGHPLLAGCEEWIRGVFAPLGIDDIETWHAADLTGRAADRLADRSFAGVYIGGGNTYRHSACLTEVPAVVVSDLLEELPGRFQVVPLPEAERHVDNRLGGEAIHRCAADVLDRRDEAIKQLEEQGSFSAVDAAPSPIVVAEHHSTPPQPDRLGVRQPLPAVLQLARQRAALVPRGSRQPSQGLVGCNPLGAQDVSVGVVWG